MNIVRKIATFLNRRAAVILAVEVLVLLGGGVTYSLHLGPKLAWPDPNEDLLLAENLLEYGAYTYDGLRPAVHRAPGFPFYLLAWKALGAGVIAIRIGYFVVMAITLVLLYRLTSSFSSPAAGVLATTAVLFYPVQFYVTGTVYPQPLGAMLLLAGLVLLTGKTKPSPQRAWLGGLAFALLILTIPTFLFSLVLLLGWLIYRYRTQALVTVLCVVLPVVVIVGAWTHRNYHIFGSFVPVAANGGLNFLYANNENATPYSGVDCDISRFRDVGDVMAPDKADKYFRQQAAEWIRANPKRAGYLYLRRLIHSFGFYDDVVSSPIVWWKKLIMYMTFGPMLVILAVRLAFWRRLPPSSSEKLLIAIYLLNAVVMACFVVRIRYRLPLDYLLIAVLAAFVSRLLAKQENECHDTTSICR